MDFAAGLTGREGLLRPPLESSPGGVEGGERFSPPARGLDLRHPQGSLLRAAILRWRVEDAAGGAARGIFDFVPLDVPQGATVVADSAMRSQYEMAGIGGSAPMGSGVGRSVGRFTLFILQEREMESMQDNLRRLTQRRDPLVQPTAEGVAILPDHVFNTFKEGNTRIARGWWLFDNDSKDSFKTDAAADAHQQTVARHPTSRSESGADLFQRLVDSESLFPELLRRSGRHGERLQHGERGSDPRDMAPGPEGRYYPARLKVREAKQIEPSTGGAMEAGGHRVPGTRIYSPMSQSLFSPIHSVLSYCVLSDLRSHVPDICGVSCRICGVSFRIGICLDRNFGHKKWSVFRTDCGLR